MGSITSTVGAASPAADPDWTVLSDSAFQAAIAALVVVLGTAVVAIAMKKWKSPANPGKDWDFSESWASNITIGSSALAAVIASSDVVAAVEGDKATVAPVIVVGGAIALALVTAAPLLVATFAKDGKIWTWAIAAAGFLTLWGTVLQILVILRLSSTLALGGIESWTWLFGSVFLGLLGTYSVRSLWGIFTMGQVTINDLGLAPNSRRRGAIL